MLAQSPPGRTLPEPVGTRLFRCVACAALLAGCSTNVTDTADAPGVAVNPYPAAAETPLLWSAEQWKRYERGG